MEPNKKEQARQLASDLQKSSLEEVRKFKQMIGLLLDDAKHNLIKAEGDAFLRLQGEARLLDRLYEQLTRPRIELPSHEGND